MGSWSAARLGTTRGRCEQTHVPPGRGMRGEEGLCQAAVRSFSWCAIRGVGYGLLSLQMKDALNGNIAFKLLIDSKSEYALLHKEIWNQNSSWVLKANSNLLRKKAQFCLPRWNVVKGNRKTAQPVCSGIMQKGFLQTWLWAPVSKQDAAKPQVWSQSLVSRSRKPECWFSCFYLFVIGVLWLLPIWKDCSAPLDTPVTFYAWSLLQFWHYFPQSYERELNQYPLSVLLCPCLPLCLFKCS